MNAHTPSVKPAATFAALKNITLFIGAVHALIDRPPNVEGFGVMYGESGLGKSYSTIYARNKTDAILVEVGESFSKGELLRSILRESGIAKPKGTIASLTRDVIMTLGDDRRRPLIIDEADKLVDKGMIEIVREIHDKSQVPVLLVGEELLPKKLQAIERVHNRVTEWVPAQRCDLEDCRKLAAMFLVHATTTEDLLDHVRRECDGRARRIVTTLNKMTTWARNNGVGALNRDNYKGDIFTGKPPVRPQAPRVPGVAA